MPLFLEEHIDSHKLEWARVRSYKSQVPWENGQVQIKHSYYLHYRFTFPGATNFSNNDQTRIKFSLCDFTEIKVKQIFLAKIDSLKIFNYELK